MVFKILEVIFSFLEYGDVTEYDDSVLLDGKVIPMYGDHNKVLRAKEL